MEQRSAKRIKNLAEKHNSEFTQFVDDGVMSGSAYIDNLRKLINKIIKQEGFTSSPKPHKRQTRYRHQEQIVTGVKVNYRIDVSSETYNNLNTEIQRLKSEVKQGFMPDEKTITSVQGKISHIKMLNFDKGNKLQHQFELLHRG